VLERRIDEILRGSLERMRVDQIDLLLLHSQLQPDEGPTAPRLLGLRSFREVVRPALERLRGDGVIGAWGLTAVGLTRTVTAALADDSKPDAVQCVANALDMVGDMWMFGPDEHPDNAAVRAAAVREGVPVIGIRAVAAGSLTDSLDREVDADHPAARDFDAAAAFRRLAAERGETAALLAHRYALSMPELATVVLGVKNRAELDECLAAAAAGPLSDEEMRTIDALRAG
jgi:aryl-alcohol dehydrogenase-like predicted oxidoreductase